MTSSDAILATFPKIALNAQNVEFLAWVHTWAGKALNRQDVYGNISNCITPIKLCYYWLY